MKGSRQKIYSQSVPPITVAQDGEIFAEFAVSGREGSPDNRRDPHHREKICADDGGLNPLSLIAIVQGYLRRFRSKEQRQVLEDVIVILPILECRIRSPITLQTLLRNGFLQDA
jgi:hypothetical protein